MRTDAELLTAYASRGDEAAFAELAARHGAMVYRTCLRVLGSREEAEDASQAAFLVLVRKARSLSKKGNLAAWLHSAARNVSLRASRARKHRAKREEKAAVLHEKHKEEAAGAEAGVAVELDRALAALPAAQRQAVVLRYLEGRGEKEAAQLAGCPQGTLSQRASRGLAGLRARLSRSGVVLGTAALIAALEAEAAAVVPEALLASLTALPAAAAAGTASGGAALLADGAIKAMTLVKVKIAAAAVCAATVVAGSAALGVKALDTGRTYYVSAAAGAAGAGSAASPFDDAIEAAARLEPGDTLIFRGGTYRCRKDSLVGLGPVRSGRPGRPITFKAHPGEKVIVDGSGSDWGFTSNGRSHIVIDGFEIRNGTGYGVKISARSEQPGVTGTNVTVRNCRIIDTGKEGVFAWETPNVVVENCLTRGSKTSQGVSIQMNCHNSVVRGVTSESNALNGIKVRGLEGMLVENCLLRNNGRGLEVGGAKDCTFRNNVIFGNGWRGPKDSSRYDVVFTGAGKDVEDPACRDNLFERNTVANPVGRERKVSRLVQVNNGCTRTTFRGNLFYVKGLPVFGFYGNCTEGHVFEDNLLFSTADQHVFVSGGVGVLKLPDFAAKYKLKSAGNAFADPLFADVAAGKLDLKPDSPAGSRGAKLPVGCSLPASDAPTSL
ncbi:MAG: sigma-70 family RNA polymerase sigma factor [Planctomycetota bacterium]|jgi:RNA polymerase sigma factor (sigma-70 family)